MRSVYKRFEDWYFKPSKIYKMLQRRKLEKECMKEVGKKIRKMIKERGIYK